MTEITDGEARTLWLLAGGSFHGPKIEHGSIKEVDLLPLLKWMAKQTAALDEIRRKCYGFADCRHEFWCITNDALLPKIPYRVHELLTNVKEK
jgi:hypothetical protein